MGASPPDRGGASAAAPSFTIPHLVRFSLPLTLTFLMMSGAAPLVSNGITWTQGAEGERTHLSAFLMTFATALFIYSPMFTARNVAIRTVRDRRSFGAFARFYGTWALLSAAVMVVVSRADAAGHLLFGRLLKAPPEIEALARQGLILFAPMPMLIALRGLGQGCHITNGETWYVGVGTALRFAAMALFVFGFVVHRSFPGPVLGGLTYLVGIGVETLFVLILLRGRAQLQHRAAEPTLGFAGLGRYAGPLMLGSVLQQLSPPILIMLINSGDAPAENGAAFNLLRDTAWILFSTLMTVQPVVISHATSRPNFRVILRFASVLAAAATALTALVALTPVREAVFVRWLRIDNPAILRLTFTCLAWLIPIPAVTLANHGLAAMHTRSGRTAWVTAGNLAGTLFLLILARARAAVPIEGAVLAVIAQGAYQMISAAVQVAGLRRGGIDATLSPVSLAESLAAAAPTRRAGSRVRSDPTEIRPCPSSSTPASA